MLPQARRLGKTLGLPRNPGKRFFGTGMNLEVFSIESGPTRFGVVISKKVAKSAVDRNHIKRQIYEVIRPLLPLVKPDFGVVVYSLPKIAEYDYAKIKLELENLLKQADVLNSQLL